MNLTTFLKKKYTFDFAYSFRIPLIIGLGINFNFVIVESRETTYCKTVLYVLRHPPKAYIYPQFTDYNTKARETPIIIYSQYHTDSPAAAVSNLLLCPSTLSRYSFYYYYS